jgi:DNA-directed RNA polymerase subunit K/omega
MTYIPRHKVTDLIPNKFEAIKVAALEARRLNARARTLAINLPGKITSLAVGRLVAGKVDYFDRRERERLAQEALQEELQETEEA